MKFSQRLEYLFEQTCKDIKSPSSKKLRIMSVANVGSWYNCVISFFGSVEVLGSIWGWWWSTSALLYSIVNEEL